MNEQATRKVIVMRLGYDVIGDIHGHADKLEGLLESMGYARTGSGYRAPHGRQAVFLGDLIDRGPDQVRVLSIVRSMVDSGAARCILGNHEFNAIGYLTDDPGKPGEAYRPNRVETPKAIKNRKQHAEFLAQVGEGSASHQDWVRWFRTLPVCLDLDGVRVVHGGWDDGSVAALQSAGWVDGVALDDALLHLAYDEEGAVGKARKRLTCGLELALPQGRFIRDKAGHEHQDVRVADWRYEATDFSQVALVPPGQEELLDGMDWPAGLELRPIEGSPILIGHHWFQGVPKVECPKLACLDWSAAKDGPLVAYRWDGEDELSDEKLFWVQA
ncbi:metallophosphoesterase [Ottowia sp.]|uniref:metallophosphoesterase n=1 Tax=Ottowia sp. TaxID=1898956 RepID=UPI00395320DB